METSDGICKNAEPKLAVTFVCKACGYERYLRQRANVENSEKTQEWEEILNYIVEEAGHFKTAKEWQEAQEAFGDNCGKVWHGNPETMRRRQTER